MKIDYVYCGTCKGTTRHMQREKDGDWECRTCRRKKNVSGQHKPVSGRSLRNDQNLDRRA